VALNTVRNLHVSL